MRIADVAVLAPFLALAAELGLGPAALLGVLLARWAATPALWWAVFASLGAALVLDPLGAANHHWMLTWMALLLALRGHRSSLGPRALYATMMGLAVIHKLRSQSYLDGSMLAWLLVEGGLFPWAMEPLGLQWMVERNLAVVPPGPAHLAGPVQLAVLGKLLAWTLLAWEAVLVALAPSRWFPPVALLFVVLLPFVRAEWVFASTVAVLTGLGCIGRWRQAALAWGVCCAVASLV
ncbi:MAG: hypothetical protein KTR31_25800 [Myxococcales bacterium]|nr:hypothetical protein [Myxococcales bacterium]